MSEWQGRKVRITEARRQHLILEKVRTQVSEYKLLKHAKEVPQGLYHQNIGRVLKGELHWMRTEFFHFVVREWAAHKTLVELTPDMLDPDYDWKKATFKTGTRKKRDKQITKEDLALLEAELERTGTTWRRLLNSIFNKPDKLTSTILSNIRHGRLHTIETEYWQLVIDTLNAMPDKGKYWYEKDTI